MSSSPAAGPRARRWPHDRGRGTVAAVVPDPRYGARDADAAHGQRRARHPPGAALGVTPLHGGLAASDGLAARRRAARRARRHRRAGRIRIDPPARRRAAVRRRLPAVVAPALPPPPPPPRAP